jgi:hypothetical protein
MRALCLLAAAAIVLGLFTLGGLPGAGSLFPPPWDKLAHVSLYASLALLLWASTAAATSCTRAACTAGAPTSPTWRPMPAAWASPSSCCTARDSQ